MALTSRIQATRLVGEGSTFRTVDTEALVTTSERSFRPVDTAVGPDGAIYVADWCDIRMDHTDPRDTWDKSCGRIWRLRPGAYSPVAPFDLARRSSQQLVQLLGDTRKWYRDHARRLLGERGDRSLVPQLRRLTRENRGQLALRSAVDGESDFGDRFRVGARAAGSSRCAGSILDAAAVESRVNRSRGLCKSGWSGWRAPSRMPR